MILVISHPGDLHAQSVMAETARLRATAMLDLSRFPVAGRLSLGYGLEQDSHARIAYTVDGQTLDLEAARAVWWRRPQPFGFDPRLGDGPAYRFAYNECQEVIGGLWQMLDARWVNDPARDEAAHRKALQLQVAGALGLSVPKTLITNDPTELRAFLASRSDGARVIYKPLSATTQEWRETRVLGPAELNYIEALHHAPVIFQDYVPGVDVRVTIVGERVFAAAIDATTAPYPIDFRMNMDRVAVRATQLPAEIEVGLLALMRRLGLDYGAIDLRRDADGNFWFLEINPAGQWLFVEYATGQPIARALAEHLAAVASERSTMRA